MRLRIFFYLFLLFLCQSLHAQIDSILSLPGNEQQLKGFIDWAAKNIFWNGAVQQDEKISLVQEATRKFEKTGNQKLIREAWFFMSLAEVGGPMQQTSQWQKHAGKMLRAAGIAQQNGWDYTEAECLMAASTIYFANGSIRDGFKQIHRFNDIIEKIGPENYPEANRLWSEIGARYYNFNDYGSAITYFRKAFNVQAPWASFHRSFDALNTFALSFRKLEKIDSAIHYFKRAEKDAVNAGNSFWMAFINGNLGYLYSDIGKDKEAEAFLLKDFEVSSASGEPQSAAKSAIALATIYTNQKKVKEAEEYIAYSQRYIDTSTLAGKVGICDRLSKLYKAKNDYAKAYAYLDSLAYFDDQLSKQLNSKAISHTKLMNEMAKYNTHIALLESEQKISSLVRNGIIGLTILVCIAAALLVNRIRAKKNLALKKALLEKKLVADELSHAKSKLNSFTKLLTEKNKLVESFRSGIEKIQSTAVEDEAAIFSQLSESTLLTADDWKQFRELFDKVYPGFFIRLKDKIPAATASDMRIAALLKLRLLPKEMASMLGIGSDAVRKAKQRLRAKINIENSDLLEEFVDSIC